MIIATRAPSVISFDACTVHPKSCGRRETAREAKLGFDFLTLKFVIWEMNNKEIGLDICIPES